MKFVEPKVYWIGTTAPDMAQLCYYLQSTGNQSFYQEMVDYSNNPEALISFYAKLCYKSFREGQNLNVGKTRGITGNLKATVQQGHGSVWEHVYLNFVATDVSRVFTHELVRHRVGTSFSQTSGRYVRGDEISFVHDPILDDVKLDIMDLIQHIEDRYNAIVAKLALNEKDMSTKKKITSALRRILPNGQANVEIGFGLNLRSLRNVVIKRTSRHAEWEIRKIFEQVYTLTRDKFQQLWTGCECVDGEVTGNTL